jgi:predicted flap endonuclease-1-like 5' DNA nuclease
MSPGLFSDKRGVVALIIAIPLALIAIFIVRPIDYNLSLGVFGVAVVLFLLWCLLDTADEFEKPAQPTPVPKEAKKPKPAEPEEEEHTELHVPAVEKPAAPLTDLPIESIEGIGPVYGAKLRNAGIPTVEEMLAADPENVAAICDINIEQAERWIAMSRFSWLDTVSEEDAEAIVFATGMEDLKSLSEANAENLYKKISAALAEGDVRVPAGYKFSVEQIQKWIDEAKSLV